MRFSSDRHTQFLVVASPGLDRDPLAVFEDHDQREIFASSSYYLALVVLLDPEHWL